jgi:ankyrin repeat protein
VTIIATPATLRHLARFLEQAADDIDDYGSDFDHDHFALFAGHDPDREYWGGDVTVLHPSAADREDRGDAFLSTLPPLGRAARLGDEAVVSELLAAGEDPNQADESGYTGLLAACDALSPGIVKRLLDAGANVEAAAFGFTPLMSAAGGGSLEICAIACRSRSQRARAHRPPSPRHRPGLRGARRARGGSQVAAGTRGESRRGR